MPFNDNFEQMSVYSMKNNRNLSKVRCSCSKYGLLACLLDDYLLILTRKPKFLHTHIYTKSKENLQFDKIQNIFI